jgi:hypothetical protein
MEKKMPTGRLHLSEREREREKMVREGFVGPWGSIQCWAGPAVSVRFLFFPFFSSFLFYFSVFIILL